MTLQPIHRRELIRPRLQPESSSSSTISRLANEAKHCPAESRRRVCFRETTIEYSNTQIAKEECCNFWYSQEDIKTFKAATVRLAKKILKFPTKEQQEWMEDLVAAYEALAKAVTADDMKSILEHCCLMAVDPSLVGMEKWLLRPVVHDKLVRHKQLHGFTRAVARDTSSSSAHRVKALRKASRELSRPSRLFSHHVALAALAA
eukprot:scaffold14619_cov146-Amphora_coffeaeformis.AAC.4